MTGKAPDRRTIERILMAASSTPTADHREASVLGGLVASLCSKGKFDLNYARHHAQASMDWAVRQMIEDTDHSLACDSHDAPLDEGETWTMRRHARVRANGVTTRKVTELELRAMCQRLLIAYRGDDAGAAA